MSANLKDILHMMVGACASDIHLKVGSHPILRIDGRLVPCREMSELTVEDTWALFEHMTSDEQRNRFASDLELDFAYHVEGLGRFRVNACSSRGEIGLVLRMVASKIPSIDVLGLPEVCKSLAAKRRGLIVITGPVGSGKSTTLAAMVNHLNENEERKIVTIEDPIEYVHEQNKCLICQQQLGEDTTSFAAALRCAVREDPDVIVVGEMRDATTTAAALSAAEIGHLVLTTMQTPSAAQVVDRIIDMFPADQQHQVCMQLSMVLEGVIFQRLVPTADGLGRVPAMEVMLTTPAVRNLTREGKAFQLVSTIETGRQHGMQTMDGSLQALCLQGRISRENAIDFSINPSRMESAFSGRGSAVQHRRGMPSQGQARRADGP